jgi:LuxR family maltose regulon positive regulatory protein
LNRERLQWSRFEQGGEQIIALLAPTGFGKTSQLVQWRREALAKGALAFWYSIDKQDQPLRLARGLTYTANAACGTHGFSEQVMQWIDDCADPRDIITAWLAEIARLSVDVVLLLDDVDELPISARTQVLPYLFGNAPANLHIVLTAQPTSALKASGTLAPGSTTLVTTAELRFNLAETISLLSSTAEGHCNPNTGARLQELTEGWPLGVQLAVAALNRGGNVEELDEVAIADIRRYFVETFIDRQPADTVHMLVRLSQFDLLHPQLCTFVLGQAGVAENIRQLQNETPLILTAESDEWMRLNPLARKVLSERLAKLPEAERQTMSQRAAEWYAEHDLFEEAAQQLFLAGDATTALAFVERSTHQMTESGRSTAVLSWYQRMSAEEVGQRPGFWAPAAWALAMSENHVDAQPLINLILAQRQLSADDRFEAALIEATAAAFADRVDLIASVIKQWPEPPAEANPGHFLIYAITKSSVALYKGQPDSARLMLDKIASFDYQLTYSPVSYGFADFNMGLCYLWGGHYSLAEQMLRPALARAEERLGRKNSVTCMLAALLAQVCWETDKSDDATLLLAGRLTILERRGLPEALMAAYKTLARIADQAGRQDQALSLLDSLHAIGKSRGLIRFQALALSELVRLHALHARADTALFLAKELKTLILQAEATAPEVIIPWLNLHVEMALARAHLVGDSEACVLAAIAHAELAAKYALSLKRTGDLVDARLMLGEALERSAVEDAKPVFAEAFSLAQAEGMVRLMRECRGSNLPDPEALTRSAEQANPEFTAQAVTQVSDTALLTPKEREVLMLLGRNFSNKEIARAMDIGAETVKWHVKNLFSKLDAGNRKHVVARARMLGLFKI